VTRAITGLFVAATLLLVAGVAIVTIQDTGDDDVAAPADGTITGDASPAPDLEDDTDVEEVDPTPSPSPEPTDPDATDDPDAPVSDEDADRDAASGDDANGDAEVGDRAEGDDANGEGDRPPLALDDMPETGGSAPATLAGLVIAVAGMGLVRRR
jgi:hypothetical protein